MTIERNELELLLPWYVNGTLDADSRKRIEVALKTDSGLRHALAVAREEQDAVSALNEAIDLPSNALLDRIMDEVNASGRGRLSSARSSIAEAFKAYVTSFSPRSLAFAGCAVAAVLVLQAVTIGYQQIQSSGYGLAADHGTNEPAKGGRLIVKFSPGAELDQVAALLQKLDLAIIDGPKADGLFVLAPRQENSSSLDNILQQLQANPELITFSTKASVEEN